MVINKIGASHIEYGKNCQDSALYENNIKIVCDGCSEGEHTEVGAWMFLKMVSKKINYSYDDIFQELLKIFGGRKEDIVNFLCFTTLLEYDSLDENLFCVNYCGDGYIILQKQDGSIEFEKLDNGEYPAYPIYNYIPKEWLGKHYKDGVNIVLKTFSKSEYMNVGVASDGIRFILDCGNEDLKNKFIEILKSGKEVKMKRFINKNQSLFKDDVSIVF